MCEKHENYLLLLHYTFIYLRSSFIHPYNNQRSISGENTPRFTRYLVFCGGGFFVGDLPYKLLLSVLCGISTNLELTSKCCPLLEFLRLYRTLSSAARSPDVHGDSL